MFSVRRVFLQCNGCTYDIAECDHAIGKTPGDRGSRKQGLAAEFPTALTFLPHF